VSLAHIRVLRDEGATHIFELGRQMRDWLDPGAWAAADLDARIQYAIDAHGWIRSSFGEPPKPLLFEVLPSGVTGGFDPETGEVLADPDVLLEGDLSNSSRHWRTRIGTTCRTERFERHDKSATRPGHRRPTPRSRHGSRPRTPTP
jgi:hypothetical protein